MAVACGRMSTLSVSSAQLRLWTRLFLQTEHCAQASGGLIYHLNSTPVPPVTFSLGHFFFTGIRKRQLHQQRSRPERGRERERGEKDGSEKKGGRRTRKQWLYLELVVHGGIDK